MNHKKQTVKYFDLFAGIGGFRTAVNNLNSESCKFEHVAFCEIDKQARQFYNAAYGSILCYSGKCGTTQKTNHCIEVYKLFHMGYLLVYNDNNSNCYIAFEI